MSRRQKSLAVTITSKQNGLANEFNFPLSESGFSTLDLSSLPPVNSGSSDSDPLVLGAKTGGGSGDSAQTNTTGSANSPATTRSLLLAFLVVVGGYVVGYGIGRVKKQLAINNKQ